MSFFTNILKELITRKIDLSKANNYLLLVLITKPLHHNLAIMNLHPNTIIIKPQDYISIVSKELVGNPS